MQAPATTHLAAEPWPAKTGQDTQQLQQRIRQAIESTPAEAGPMNAHRPASRALAEMQKLRPSTHSALPAISTPCWHWKILPEN